MRGPSAELGARPRRTVGTSRSGRGVAAPFDFEPLLRGRPVEDIATTCDFLGSHDDSRSLNDAFPDGYEMVPAWPERYSGEIDRLIARQALVIGSAGRFQPEWRHASEETLDRGERRIRDVLNLCASFCGLLALHTMRRILGA